MAAGHYPPILRGCIPYGAEYVIHDGPAGRVIQRLAPGCFAEAVRAAGTVPCRIGHEDSLTLGHAGVTGTARVWETPEGLQFGVLLEGWMGELIAGHIRGGGYLGASFEGPARLATDYEKLPDG